MEKMEIGDSINKVSCRKRINTDVEELRDKVSWKTAKMIKLKVAQDTAYWHFKEKLQQVNGNRERLQQNMMEVQMQHETISGQCQEELRLRPDTLNKVSSCREISEVLQEYSERLKATLSRCKADQAALCEAYHRSGQIVRDMKTQQHQAEVPGTSVAMALDDKVKTMTERQNQLVQFFAAFKQQSESAINELKSTVNALRAQEQEIVKANNELNKNLHQYRLDIEKRNDTITSLQNDLKQLVSEYNTQSSESIQQKEKKLKEQLNKEKELKQALQNQEKYTQSVCDQNNELIDKVVAIRFVTQIDNKEKSFNKYAEEMNTLKAQAGAKDIQICNLTTELEQCRQEMMTKILNIEELKNAVNNEANDSEELKRSFEMYKNTVQAAMQELQNRLENKDKELDLKNQKLEEITADVGKKTKTEERNTKYKELDSMKTELDTIKKQLEVKDQELVSKDKELDSKRNTIAKLMMELKTGTDVRSKLEMDLERLRQETSRKRELESKKQNKMAKKIEHLEASVKDKEKSVTKQMSIIKEMRHEKERLQEKIQGMQNTIDNIQKEFTGRPAPPRAADLDDNAVVTKLQNRLENKDKELDLKNQKLEEITADVGKKTKTEELNTKYKELDSMKTELDTIKKQLEVKDQELVSKDKELDSKRNTIAKLMMELKTGTDVRSKLEMDLERLRQETSRKRELESKKQNKMAKKIEHLEASVKDKEKSVTKQMSIIKEMRHEKERLQEKIQGMQNTIDNIQKEFTGRPAPPRAADLDDNAVMLTTSKGSISPSQTQEKNIKNRERQFFKNENVKKPK